MRSVARKRKDPIIPFYAGQHAEVYEGAYAGALALDPQSTSGEIQGNRLVGAHSGLCPMVVLAKHSQAAATEDTRLDAGDDVVRGVLKELSHTAPADHAANLVALRGGERGNQEEQKKATSHGISIDGAGVMLSDPTSAAAAW
jgi:hypothetical protein